MLYACSLHYLHADQLCSFSNEAFHFVLFVDFIFSFPADFHVPSEYLTNIHIRDKVPPSQDTPKVLYMIVMRLIS